MKILHVFGIFSLKYGGGTCDVIYKLSQEQSKNHQVSIYTSDYLFEKEYAESLKGVVIYPFKSIFNLLPFRVQVHSFASIFNFTPSLIIWCFRFLDEFDVIHFHAQRSMQNIIIYCFARLFKVPYIIDSHGSSPFLKRASLKRLYDLVIGNQINKHCSKFITESPIGKKEYNDLGIKDNDIEYIQPSFVLDEFNDLPQKGEFRNKYQINENKIITFVGRIHWVKGLDFLVETYAELLNIRSDVKLVIVGEDDGYLPELNRIMGKLGIRDKILFTGFLQGKEKLSAFVDSDIVIQPSRYEQGAWMPLEAVLCGTPIIVMDGTGAGDDIRKMNSGYLVKFGDVQGLLNTIEHILENKKEAELLTQRANKWVRDNLDLSKNVEKYIRVYEDVKVVG